MLCQSSILENKTTFSLSAAKISHVLHDEIEYLSALKFSTSFILFSSRFDASNWVLNELVSWWVILDRSLCSSANETKVGHVFLLYFASFIHNSTSSAVSSHDFVNTEFEFFFYMKLKNVLKMKNNLEAVTGDTFTLLLVVSF